MIARTWEVLGMWSASALVPCMLEAEFIPVTVSLSLRADSLAWQRGATQPERCVPF